MTRAEVRAALENALALGHARFYDEEGKLVSPANPRRASVIAFQRGFCDWNAPELALMVSEAVRGLVGRGIPICTGFPERFGLVKRLGAKIDPPKDDPDNPHPDHVTTVRG